MLYMSVYMEMTRTLFRDRLNHHRPSEPMSKISKLVLDAVLQQLHEIEVKHGVRVLYACESGSRAWGFASADSDYDVRFIYVHPQEWYLSIDLEDKRDVIEAPIDGKLDISGWDLRESLKLYRKSNPVLLEWLGSPIVYKEHGSLAARLRELSSDLVEQDWPIKTRVVNDNELIIQLISNLTPPQ